MEVARRQFKRVFIEVNYAEHKWRCPDCRFVNFKTREKCNFSTCKKTKPRWKQMVPKNAQSYSMKLQELAASKQTPMPDNDWICSLSSNGCGRFNYAKNTKCYQCNKMKSVNVNRNVSARVSL